jgi:transcriptional regulator with XRE-family HTH domain
MLLTSAQCRAARGLLNWTQEHLATNAVVSRATIADFESNARQPMKNNLRSIADCMFAAGVEFIPEEGLIGVGVCFRERKLQYISSVRIDQFSGVALLKMTYAGEDFICAVNLEAVNDYHRTNSFSDDELREAVADMLHVILSAAERLASTNIRDGKLTLTYEMLGTG